MTRPALAHPATGRRGFLGLVAVGGLLSACGSPADTTDGSAAASGAAASGTATSTRTLQLPGGGSVVVPTAPRRVVALDNFAGVVFDLGVPMVGRNNYLPPWKEGDAAFVALPEVDDADYIADPEVILPLRPDVILSTAYQVEGVAKLLGSIAPVVVVPDDYTLDWRAFMAFTGDAVGVDGQAKVDEIVARATRIGADLGLAGRSVGIVRPMGNGEFRLMGAGGFGGDLLTAAGADVLTIDGDDYAQVSVERLGDVDTESIVLWTDEAGVSAQDIDAKLAEVTDNPLWKTLPAVRADRVYRVGEQWIGMDVQAATLVLDDIEKNFA